MKIKKHAHGMFSGGAKPPPEYWVWSEMRQRCQNMKAWAWRWYGAKGIKVCDRWDDPSVFIADMGPKPSPKHTLDRIDTLGDYEPGNCRWATMLEQSRNKTTSISIDGVSIAEIAESLGMNYSSVYRRLRAGWPPEKIMNTQKTTNGRRSNNRLLTVGETTMTIAEWSRETGLPFHLIHSRVERGVSHEEAIMKGDRRHKGEACYQSKLTAKQVIEIRNSGEKGTVLAKQYGVSSTLIYMIKKNKIWVSV